jgi:hypothetical protein
MAAGSSPLRVMGGDPLDNRQGAQGLVRGEFAGLGIFAGDLRD